MHSPDLEAKKTFETRTKSIISIAMFNKVAWMKKLYPFFFNTFVPLNSSLILNPFVLSSVRKICLKGVEAARKHLLNQNSNQLNVLVKGRYFFYLRKISDETISYMLFVSHLQK